MPAANTWTSAEEVALVAFLHDNRAEAGDGGCFKKSTFQRAAQDIASVRGNGQAKDVKSCQNKWTAVCLTVSFSFCRHLLIQFQASQNLSCYPSHQRGFGMALG